MSLLLRHPGCVPSLFSRGVEAEEPARALSFRLRATSRRSPRRGRPGSSPAAIAMMAVFEVPLLKAATALFSLSLLH